MFIVCGLNHKTAPIELRERFAITFADTALSLQRILALPHVHEVILLSTCNRLEIYAEVDSIQDLLKGVAKIQKISKTTLLKHFYVYEADKALSHALQVASGLDSMIFGEPQIFGQFKKAYALACSIGTVGKNLRFFFEYVFNVSKNIRTVSGITKNPVSIGSVATLLIKQHVENFASLRVLLIGSGELATLVGKYLQKNNVKNFIIARRNTDQTGSLSSTLSGKVINIVELENYLADIDLLISATSCPLPFISKTMITTAMHIRNNAPLLCLDLAVPRDIEESVGEITNIKLLNIDHLEQIAATSMHKRQKAARAAKNMVEEAVVAFFAQYRALKAQDIICNFRQYIEEHAKQELNRAKQKLSLGHCQLKVLEEFAARLVKKMLHVPTTGLKQIAAEDKNELLSFTKYLFKVPAGIEP